MDTNIDCSNCKSFALYDPAFFVVQEKIKDEDFNLLHTTEIVGLLRCLERENMGNEYICLYSVRKLCSGHIKLFQFHHKRNRILQSVAKIVSEVCKRAFQDIITSDSQFVDAEGDKMWFDYIILVIEPPPYDHNFAVGFPRVGFGGNLVSGHFMTPTNKVGNVSEVSNADPRKISGGIRLVNDREDEGDVAPDDRTVFLTFSKGYYILESEIREFFTGIFGYFIQGIHMQDVPSNQHPLYARMVCRSSAIIPNIAPTNRKTSYSINGFLERSKLQLSLVNK